MTTTTSTVRTADGSVLHVEVDEVPDAPVTVVFVHGSTRTCRSRCSSATPTG